jgi:molecular chaperone Hsp33
MDLTYNKRSAHINGRSVRLGPALNYILHQHAYPVPVGHLLGEAMVIAAALGTALKFEGVFTFQAKTDGPVRLLVADVTNDGGIRAYAQFSPAGGAAGGRLLGKGYVAFTIDQKLKDERYQGIVEMEGHTLAEAVQHYFRQSEQLPTGIVVAVRQDAYGHWRGGCLMLQQIPHNVATLREHDTSIEDAWIRAMLLLGTCTPDELTDPALEANELLYRLFHEEGVRIYDPLAFRHQCRCSEKRVKNMLRSLPRNEIEALAIKGIVDITCEFCNKNYRFDEKERYILYSENLS